MAEPNALEKQSILQKYGPLYSAIETRDNPNTPLLLAHYTTVPVVQKILSEEQLWFSNPLYMNDLSEMRSGILLASQVIPAFVEQAGGTPGRAQILLAAYNSFVAHLSNEAAIDTYVFCLSTHPIGDTDGRLSMWREYADKGNGAALVFNAQKVRYQPHSPLIIAKVKYRTDQQRIAELKAAFTQWTNITVASDLPIDHLFLAAYAAFDIAKAFALTTKHTGFFEEDEWRVIYVPERDPLGYLKCCLDYHLGNQGFEPKLKVSLSRDYLTEAPKIGEVLSVGKLTDILELILLGPSVSSPLSKKTFERMLHRIEKPQFVGLTYPSTIPLRPRI